MEKDIKMYLRDFYFSLAETIASVENCELLCPTDTIIELCETLAGVMAEQTEIIATLENGFSLQQIKDVKEKYKRPLLGERFYSSHVLAVADMMRLAKHLKEVGESKKRLLEAAKRLADNDELPPLDIRLLKNILDEIPRVKPLNDN